MPPSASPPKAVYVKSKVAVANGVEQTNPEERAIVASAQYRIRSSTQAASRSSRLSGPIHYLVMLKRMLMTGHHAPALRVPPTMVVPPFLLMGNEYNASHYDDLYSLGVTHICNLDFASRNYFEGKFVYIKLNLIDAAETDLTEQFVGVTRFCEGCEAVGGRVLVHCATGNSLAPAFVVAFLVTKKGMSISEAVQLVHSLRPTVNIYPSFLEQLDRLRIKSSTT